MDELSGFTQMEEEVEVSYYSIDRDVRSIDSLPDARSVFRKDILSIEAAQDPFSVCEQQCIKLIPITQTAEFWNLKRQNLGRSFLGMLGTVDHEGWINDNPGCCNNNRLRP